MWFFFEEKKSTSKKEAGENGNKSMESKDTIDGRGGEQEASDHCGERLVSRSHEEIVHAGYHWEESWIKNSLINSKNWKYISPSQHTESQFQMDQRLQCKRQTF